MAERVLVCILGQTRAHELTWEGFRKNVLAELGADLALSIGVDENYEISNPFHRYAKFHWTVPEFDNYRDAFNQVSSHLGSDDKWLVLKKMKGNWLGGVDGIIGSGGILIYYRWLMLKNIVENGLIREYDRFIVTRSDYYYWSPHPPLDILDSNFIWIPYGEDSLGLTDRHLIVSRQDLAISVDIISDILKNPMKLYKQMLRFSNWSLERYMYLHFRNHGLLRRIKRYPYIMATVRGPDDGATINWGEFDPEEGLIVKYFGELESARQYRNILTDGEAWRRFYVEGGFSGMNEVTPKPFRSYERPSRHLRWMVRVALDKLGLV